MKARRGEVTMCIVCSGGGHLSQAMTIADSLKRRYCLYLVTCKLPHLQDRVSGIPAHFIVDPHVSFLKYLLNAFQSLRILVREKPDVIISTGSGMTIFTCLLGRLSGSKLIFVESGSRVTTPSKTGRLLYHFAHLFVVQWPSIKWAYPRAVVGGPLL